MAPPLSLTGEVWKHCPQYCIIDGCVREQSEKGGKAHNEVLTVRLSEYGADEHFQTEC